MTANASRTETASSQDGKTLRTSKSVVDIKPVANERNWLLRRFRGTSKKDNASSKSTPLLRFPRSSSMPLGPGVKHVAERPPHQLQKVKSDDSLNNTSQESPSSRPYFKEIMSKSSDVVWAIFSSYRAAQSKITRKTSHTTPKSRKENQNDTDSDKRTAGNTRSHSLSGLSLPGTVDKFIRRMSSTYKDSTDKLSSSPDKTEPPTDTAISGLGSSHDKALLQNETAVSDKATTNQSHKSNASGLPQDPKLLAHALFHGTDLVSRREVAQILSSKANTYALQLYMNFFDFTNDNIVSAFRKFCAHLHLAGETQQVDRILSAFALRWFTCNSSNPTYSRLYLNADIAYSILFSMVLLNTDLHISNIKAKMNQRDFLRHTLNLLERHVGDQGDRSWKRDMESHLREIYNEIREHKILQRSLSLGDAMNLAGDGTQSVLGAGAREPNTTSPSCLHEKGNLSTVQSPRTPSLIRKRSNTLMGLFKRDEVTELEVSMRTSTDTESNHSTIPSNSSDVNSRHRRFSTNASIMETLGGTTCVSSPPIPPAHCGRVIKSGILYRKQVMEKGEFKARNRRWIRLWASLCEDGDKGAELFVCRCEVDAASSKFFVNTVDSIPLLHTVAITLPSPGYDSSRPNVFSLIQPTGAIDLFGAQTQGELEEWLQGINLCSAKKSREPLLTGIGSAEFGWGIIQKNDSSDLSQINLDEWVEPGGIGMVVSHASEQEQYQTMVRLRENAIRDIHHFNEIRIQMARFFEKFPILASRADANWVRRYRFLIKELTKYQIYVHAFQRYLKIEDDDESPSTDEVQDIVDCYPVAREPITSPQMAAEATSASTIEVLSHANSSDIANGQISPHVQKNASPQTRPKDTRDDTTQLLIPKHPGNSTTDRELIRSQSMVDRAVQTEDETKESMETLPDFARTSRPLRGRSISSPPKLSPLIFPIPSPPKEPMSPVAEKDPRRRRRRSSSVVQRQIQNVST